MRTFVLLCAITVNCVALETTHLKITDVQLDFFCEENGALSSNEISSLYADASGEIWLAHGYHLSLSSIRNSTIRKIDLPRQFGIPGSFAEDGHNSLWVATNKGLWRLENDSFVRHYKAGLVSALIPRDIGSLYLVSATNVSEYKNGKASIVLNPHWTLKEWPITSGCLDQHGRLWVGSSCLRSKPPDDKKSRNAALYAFDPKTEKWRSYGEDSGIRWKSLTVQPATERKGIWLLPPGEPPHLFDGEKLTEDPLKLKDHPEFTRRDACWAMKEDLLLTADTLNLYFATKQNVIHLPLDFFVKDKRFQKSLEIESLLIENEKTIWVGTAEHGAIRITLKQ